MLNGSLKLSSLEEKLKIEAIVKSLAWLQF